MNSAAKIISDLLTFHDPHYMIKIREIARTYGSEADASAEMETYCTQEFCDAAIQSYLSAQKAARAWLENLKHRPTEYRLEDTACRPKRYKIVPVGNWTADNSWTNFFETEDKAEIAVLKMGATLLR
jgi:hypothetical protein